MRRQWVLLIPKYTLVSHGHHLQTAGFVLFCVVFGEGWEKCGVEVQGWGCMSFRWHLISLAQCGLLTRQCWEGESPYCLLVIASFGEISSASNRRVFFVVVVCLFVCFNDQSIHQFLQSWCRWPCSGALPQKSPDEKSHWASVSIRYQHPFALVLMHFIFLTRAVWNTYLHVAEHWGKM